MGIEKDILGGSYYTDNSKKYFYAETTAPGWTVGELPEQVKGLETILFTL